MIIKELQLFALLIITLIGPGAGIISITKNREKSFIRTVLYSFTLSLFTWTIISSLGFLLHINLELLFANQVIIGTTGLIITAIKTKKGGFRHLLSKIKSPPSNIYLICLLLLSFLIMYWKGSFQDGDSWYHVAQANHYASQNKLKSESAYFSNLPAGTLYDFNAWHSYLGGISLFINWHARFVWINLSAFLFPLAILSLYFFINQGSWPKGFPFFAVTGIIMVNFLQKGFLFPGTTPFPSSITENILTPVFFGTYLKKERKIDHHLPYLILFTASAIHIYYFLNIIYMLTVYLVFDFLISHKTWRNLLLNLKKLTTYIAIGIPYSLSIYLYCIRGYKTVFPGTLLPTRYISNNLFILLPSLSRWDMYMSIVLSIILILHTTWKKEVLKLFIISNILVIPLIIFNPFLLTAAQTIIPLNLIIRLSWNPFLLIPGMWFFFNFLKGPTFLKTKKERGLIFITILLCGIVLFIFLKHKIPPYFHRITTYNKYSEPMGRSDFSEKLSSKIPPGSVIISDPYTSYHLPAFIDVDVIGMIAHSTPPLDLKKRINDTYRFFSPFIAAKEKKRILEKYDIDYALINENILSWIAIPPHHEIFTSTHYPVWKQESQNIRMVKFTNAETKTYNQTFTVTGKNILIYPNPAKHEAESGYYYWKHAGEIFIRANIPLKSIHISSKGGTHQIFYYAIVQEDSTIREEKTFINSLSPEKDYTIYSLSPGATLTLFGTGIAPLYVKIIN